MTSRLFDPLALGPIQLPNRLVVAPMCQYSADDGSAADWHLQHLSQLAYSGAGMVVVEATAVERRGRITHGCLGMYSDDNEAALTRVIAAARRLGGPTKFGIQLAHAGRKGSSRRPWEGGAPLSADEDRWQTVSSSDLPFGPDWHVPHALSEAELSRVIEAFVNAARRAVRAGFDVIELHCAHGYLLHEFLSPLANKRTDGYGGSLQNRLRLPLEVVRAVREVVPASIPLGMRVSASDWIPGGWDVDQTIEFVRAARSLGIEFVCASSGGIVANVAVPLALGYQVPFAAQIRKATGITTRAVGLITDPHQAERILAEGQADLVALARAFLDDPRWGWHAADALGATTHFAQPYSLVRGAGWKKLRDQARITV
ncbi:MAG TPA: NADH:flavin oxidoreductase/NADH oxidase [Steroidobacteraceae bacterium]|jgi:2,4-dienoyl-CoA reductase-like NADH-dependent reductase (Old Yellow Enzyme family)